MSAVGADGEEIIARASQHHIFVGHTHEQLAAVRKLADGNAFGEIRPWSVICVPHVNLHPQLPTNSTPTSRSFGVYRRAVAPERGGNRYQKDGTNHSDRYP